jgi:hypothetical protein
MRNEKALLVVFEELKEALIECNVNKLEKLISDDYQGFSLNGTIESKEIILQTFKPGSISLSVYSVEDIKIEMSTSFGIITGKGRIEGRYGEYEFQHDVLFTDIFKFINDSWQYFKSQTTEIKSA